VGRELGVRYVLEGASVRVAIASITGQLIETHTGAHLWPTGMTAYSRHLELQDKITEAIVGITEPSSQPRSSARRKRPENLDAYDLYLRASPYAIGHA
jgi:hypothetical protein